MKAGNREIREADRGDPAAVGRGKVATLQTANPVSSRLAGDKLARERKYASKLEDARQVMLRMSQAAAEREGALAARLHDAQQVALRMSQAAAERAHKLSDALKASHLAVAEQMQAFAERKRALHEMLEKKNQELLRQRWTIEALTRHVTEQDQELADLHASFAKAVTLFNEIQRTLLHASALESSPPHGTEIVDGSNGSTAGLQQLLRLRGRDFIVQAYRTLLHRDPDPGGFEHYLGELGRGISTVEIVRRIRHSPEGKKVAAEVRDIRVQLALAFLYHTPFVGRWFEAIGDVGSLFAFRRERRAFEYTVVQKLEQARSANLEMRKRALWIAERIARLEADMFVQPPKRRATDGPDAK